MLFLQFFHGINYNDIHYILGSFILFRILGRIYFSWTKIRKLRNKLKHRIDSYVFDVIYIFTKYSIHIYI